MEPDKYVYINIGVGVESVYVRIKKDILSGTCPYSPLVVLFCQWRTNGLAWRAIDALLELGRLKKPKNVKENEQPH